MKKILSGLMFELLNFSNILDFLDLFKKSAQFRSVHFSSRYRYTTQSPLKISFMKTNSRISCFNLKFYEFCD